MGKLTNSEVKKLNNDNPVNQLLSLGTKIQSVQKQISEDDSNFEPALIATYAIDVDRTTAVTMFTATFAMEILQVIVQCRAASGSGTATIRNGTTAITDAIIMAVDLTNIEAGTINDAQSTLAIGDTLTVITNGAADRGLVTIIAKRTD